MRVTINSLSRLGLILCLTSLPLFAQQPPQSSEDEAAIRALAAKYFETLQRKDLDGHMALWTGLEQDRTARRAMWQQRFAAEEFSFSTPNITRFQQRYGTASLYVKTERRATHINTNVTTQTPVHLVLSLVKEEVWRIAREQPASLAFLAELQSANETDQAKLLDAAPDLVTPELAQMLASQSDRMFVGGNQQNVLKTLRLLLRLAEKLNDRPTQASAWQNLGIAYFMLHDYKQALSSHQQALALEQQLGRKSESASVFSSLGLTYLLLNQPQQALEHYQKALAVFQALNERGEIAHTLEAIGDLHYNRGDYAQALKLYQDSLPYLNTAAPSMTYASSLLKVARIAYELGDDETALAHYQRTLEAYDKLNNKHNRGFVLHSIANLYYTQGDLAQALIYYQRSLEAEEAINNPPGSASALQGIGLVQTLSGNYPAALQAYQRNLQIWQAGKDKEQLARALQKVAGAHFSLGAYKEALPHYEAALKLCEELGIQSYIAGALLDLGIAQAALNNFAAALEYDEKSRALFAAINQPGGVASALLSISLVHFVQSDFAKSLVAATEAVTFAKQATDGNELLWQAQFRVGKCQFKLQQLPAARQALTEAIAILEAQRPAGGGAPFVQFNESKLAPYLAMVDVLLALNQGSEAFHYAERAKTRGLLALLRGGRVWITKTMTVAEQQRELQILNELRVLNAQIAREYEKQQPNQTRLQELGKRAQQMRLVYQEFLKRLYLAHPQLKSLRAEGSAVLAPQAGLLVSNERSALLDFIETDEYVYLFVFTKERATAPSALKIYALSTNRGDLYARLSALQAALTERAAECGTMLRELYELLIAPAQEQLKGKTQLVLAPDGLLWNLPFAALQPADNRFLIEDCALSYASSLTALQAMKQLTRSSTTQRTTSRAATTNTFAAFANPTLSEDVLTRLKTSLGREQFTFSAETENEVAALGKLFDPTRQHSYIGAEASEHHAKSEATQVRWLHFAAPMVLDEASPFFSALALATPETTDAAEDGLLTLREVIGLKLAAQLTVVSTAETTPTRAAFGRAPVSASWSFFIAGCPALLLNQWPVETASTTELMQRFYQQRLAQPSRSNAEAWQNAVRELLQNPEYRQPFYWAGFKLIGNTVN